MTSNQHQVAGDQSVNLQAQQINITNAGLSVQDVRQIVLDVFNANFYQLSSVAQNIAKQRAEEIVDKFLVELQKRNPEGINCANDPDFQYAIFTAEREYARSGDESLGNILVDLLVERSKESQRTLKQIVLNESLNIVPKLTESQINALTLLLLIGYTRFQPANLEHFKTLFETHICPFIDNVPSNDTSYQHLEFTGCSSNHMLGTSIWDALLQLYRGFFWKGIPLEKVETLVAEKPDLEKYFGPCLHDPSSYQLNVLNMEVLKERAASDNLDEGGIQRLQQLDESYKMTPLEAEAVLKANNFPIDKLGLLVEKWNNSGLKTMRLTSVGIAIAHANAKMVTGFKADLSIWIREQ